MFMVLAMTVVTSYETAHPFLIQSTANDIGSRAVADAFLAYEYGVFSLSTSVPACVGPSAPAPTWTWTGNACSSSYTLAAYVPNASFTAGSPFQHMGNYQNGTLTFVWFDNNASDAPINAYNAASWIMADTGAGTNDAAAPNIGLIETAGVITPINVQLGNNASVASVPTPPAGIPVGSLVAWQQIN